MISMPVEVTDLFVVLFLSNIDNLYDHFLVYLYTKHIFSLFNRPMSISWLVCRQDYTETTERISTTEVCTLLSAILGNCVI